MGLLFSCFMSTVDSLLAEETLRLRGLSLEEQVWKWIEGVLSIQLQSSESLQAQLKSGVLLCQCINALCPNKIKRINQSSKLTFYQMENINKFLQACNSLGIQQNQLFSVTDLYENKDMKQVLSTIAELSAVISQQTENYSGPIILRGTGTSPVVKRKVVIKTKPTSKAPGSPLRQSPQRFQQDAPASPGRVVLAAQSTVQFDSKLAGSAIKWLNSVISWNDEEKSKTKVPDVSLADAEDVSQGDFLEMLKDGVMLCKSMRQIAGTSVIPTIHEDVGRKAFKFRDNVEMYLSACKSIGMANANCFCTTDLVEGKNLSMVVSNIHSLSVFIRKSIKDGKMSWTGPLLEVITKRSHSTGISLEQRIETDCSLTEIETATEEQITDEKSSSVQTAAPTIDTSDTIAKPDTLNTKDSHHDSEVIQDNTEKKCESDTPGELSSKQVDSALHAAWKEEEVKLPKFTKIDNPQLIELLKTIHGDPWGEVDQFVGLIRFKVI